MCHLVNSRVPLEKGKSAREALEEQGLWEEYRLKYPYNPMAKFDPRFAVTGEPMTNDADVSNEIYTDEWIELWQMANFGHA